MKGLAVVLLFGFCAVVYCRPDDKYTTRYDNVDVDAILKTDRLLRRYVDCLLDKPENKNKKLCTKEGEELKKFLPDALQTDCSKCSDTQKEASRKIIIFLIKNKPDWWKELQAKFDPTGQYVARNAEELKKEGITV